MKSILAVAVLCVFSLGTALPCAAADDLNTELMNATIKISNEKSTATAFLLTRPVPGEPANDQFVLVTAAHVLEAMAGDTAMLFFRRQESEGFYKKVPHKIAIRKQGKPQWTRHPTTDIAVMAIAPPSGSKVAKLSIDLLASDESLKKHAVHPGDAVMSLGYPHRIDANEAGFPILRSGSIASFPLTPAKANKTMLVSINSFEGDSGGPVYLADANRFSGDKRQPGEVRLILGLVTGQHFLDEEAKLVYENVKIRHRLGLAIVVQAAFIKETIERLPRAP
jgi:hypothetical protein